ncbi:FUSC family protein [Streptomyces sp. HNM0575]|uniref:FUSC family protein n=1 Tax=Streptomyces sp. HNM0575 TaxID=2716338 RepID=UPI00145CB9E3|nr:FUSC family protein [Streptomyces sp. HNM0575]NLU71332.1 FUSC family protein [Streptomyces sp. HNM0575]
MRVLPWFRAFGETARSGLSVERAKLTPLIALRAAAGVAIIVLVTLSLGSPGLAVASAFGAFSSGVATFQRSWRPRPVLALCAGAALALSTFVGYLVVAHPAAFVLLLAAWAFASGLAWGLGPTAGVVASSTVACMLVTVTLPTTVLGALVHALLIAAGGCVQAALIVLVPVRPWGERRDALADALAAVSDYARRLRHDPGASFDPKPLMEARSAAAVTPRQARRRPRQLGGYRGLAERFRPVLASLADPVVGAPMVGRERDRVRELLQAAATVLDATARAVRRGERVRLPEDALDVLQVPETGPVLSGPARKAAMRLIALTQDAVDAAQEPVEVTRSLPLFPRATWQMPARPDSVEDADVYADTEADARPAQPVPPRHLSQPSLAVLAPVALRTFRRELRWSSPVCRHALRVAAVVAASYLLGKALPPEHGYWAPLTAVMVMRPDFSRTYERGVARVVGTLFGVGLAGTLTALAHPPPYASAVLAVASAGCMYLLMRTGYAITSACIGAYVVFLLGTAGSTWSQTVLERIWLTALGGALAMLSYALFPAWETPQLRGRLADWLEATGSYTVAVFDCFAGPAGPAAGVVGTPAPAHPYRKVREALLDTRAARQEWDQTATRAGAEPVRHRGGLSRRSASAAQSAMVTLGRVTMLLEAHLPDRDAEPSAGAADYSEAVRTALPDAVAAVREGRTPDWGPVHDALSRWWELESDRPSPSVALRTADLLTDAAEDLADAASR